MTKGKIVYLLYESFYKWVHHKVFYCVLCQAKCRITGTKQRFLQRIPQGNDTIHKIFQIITAEEKMIFVC